MVHDDEAPHRPASQRVLLLPRGTTPGFRCLYVYNNIRHVTAPPVCIWSKHSSLLYYYAIVTEYHS